MTRSALSACIGLFVLIAAAGGCESAGRTDALHSTGRPPNVVLIISDDLGYAELGVHGGTEVPTPNIDSIARRGVRFTQAYVSAPVCSPTRAGLMTGRYQQRFGFEHNPRARRPDEAPFGLPQSQVTLGDRFKAAGYTTGYVGKWHLGDRPGTLPQERGFDEFFGFLAGGHPYFPREQAADGRILRGRQPVAEEEYLTDAFSREAVAFIDRHRGEPFFLCLAFNAVHGPLQAPEKYQQRFEKITDARRRTFAAMLAAMDDAVGDVLDKLQRSGLHDQTLIVFVNDNGGPTQQTTARNDPLRGVKGEVYEGGIRVPMFIQWPGRVEPGTTEDRTVIALDIFPTVLAAAGTQPPAEAALDGVNLLPYITGRSAGRPHPTLYWRYGSQRAVRHGDWKLLWEQPEAPPQLYDLSTDIGESKDLASTQPQRVRELAKLYRQWDAQLAEPLWGLEGPQRARKRRAGQ